MVVPENLKIKIAKRSDTYTGNLGFINFKKNDKEWKFKGSYDNWENKPTSKEKEFINEPTSGFVINSNVGGRGSYYSDYGREMKIRVWDPRGWEIEITLDNFFEIILPLGVTAGKGIEEELVYAFNGSSVFLYPSNHPEVIENIGVSNGEINFINNIESEPFDQTSKTYEIGKVYAVSSTIESVDYYIYAGKKTYANNSIIKYDETKTSVTKNVFFPYHEKGIVEEGYWGKIPGKKVAIHKNSIPKKDIKLVSKDPVITAEELNKWHLLRDNYQYHELDNLVEINDKHSNGTFEVDYYSHVLFTLKDGKKIKVVFQYGYFNRIRKTLYYDILKTKHALSDDYNRSIHFEIYTPIEETGKYNIYEGRNSTISELFNKLGMDLIKFEDYVIKIETCKSNHERKSSFNLKYYINKI